MADDTPGERLFLIRSACGNGTRDPMPLKAFSALVRERTGVSYDPTTLSLLERNVQKWRVEDIRTLASVDPQERGAVWLSALDVLTPIAVPDPTQDRKLNQQEIARAVRQDEIETHARTRQATKKKKGGRK